MRRRDADPTNFGQIQPEVLESEYKLVDQFVAVGVLCDPRDSIYLNLSVEREKRGLWLLQGNQPSLALKSAVAGAIR